MSITSLMDQYYRIRYFDRLVLIVHGSLSVHYKVCNRLSGKALTTYLNENQKCIDAAWKRLKDPLIDSYLQTIKNPPNPGTTEEVP